MQSYAFVYCVSCNAGSESALKKDILRKFPQAVVLYPVFDREELKAGAWFIKSRPLMPGYIFIYSSISIAPQELYLYERINRVLSYASAEREYTLYGADLEFAHWLFSHEGHIGISRAMLVGDKTQIIDGPLKRYEGEIIKIDRRRRSALVAVNVGDTIKNVWLGLHWMTLKDGVLVDWERPGRIL